MIGKSEWEIISHRLDVADAILESLADDYGDDELTVAIQDLQEMGTGMDVEGLSQIQRDVVIDCLTGSTFFAGSEESLANGELKYLELKRQRHGANKLEDRFFKMGIIANIPIK